MATFQEYGDYSGFKLNLDKSLALATSSVLRDSWPGPFPLQWASSSFRYLGILLTPRTSVLYRVNIDSLFCSSAECFARWSPLPLSLLGRIHLFNMVLFPKWLYTLQLLPLWLLKRDITKLHSMLSRFCWGGRRPRVALHYLFGAWGGGGLGLPHFRLYNAACLMRFLGEWLSDRQDFIPKFYEKEFFAPWHILSLVHTPHSALPAPLRGSLLLHSLRVIWSYVLDSWNGTPSITRYLPIQGNLQFSPGMETASFRKLASRDFTLLTHVLQADGSLLSWDALVRSGVFSVGDFLAFRQLHHYVRSLPRTALAFLIEDRFAALLDPYLEDGFTVSGLYKDFHRLLGPTDRAVLHARWCQDLGIARDALDLPSLIARIPGVSVNADLRECQFRVLHRGYFMKSQLYYSGYKDSPLCPKCLQQPHSFIHAFWSCVKINRFWRQVLSYVESILGTALPFSAAGLLLDKYEAFRLSDSGQRQFMRRVGVLGKKETHQLQRSCTRKPELTKKGSALDLTIIWKGLTQVPGEISTDPS
uniref:Leukocyte surface antigen CD53 isoform X2 n=1 Tax=Geotrypetes seraphini TaxID=260995 RepID=A0A6P8NG19_GEOSA|nr:leukocyte surface antigen CD53 isoform X2 [Geotrypetes seraphini]